MEGGYRLARPAAEITLADVIRAVESPLASVRSQPPEEIDYEGSPRRCSRSGWHCAKTYARSSRWSPWSTWLRANSPPRWLRPPASRRPPAPGPQGSGPSR
ncbi:MAG: Rrf2 family transcriptional regulator [Actinomycetota bacterium]